MSPKYCVSFLLGIVSLSCSLLAFSDNDTFLAADTKLPPSHDQKGTFSFVWENDVFANTDKNYTNGVRFSYMSGTSPTQGLSHYIASRIIGAEEGALLRQGWAFGHSIFTPQDIKATELLPEQHPYGAWLYGEYSTLIQQKDIVDQVTLQLGLVGANARGESVQNNFHELIGVDQAKGWGNQIDNEVGMVISYDRIFRRHDNIGDGYGIDLTPNVGLSLGNIYTNARAGVTIRYGQDLRNDFGPPRVRPSLTGAGYFTPRDSFSWYVFLGLEARAIAHNVFLDGSLFDKDDTGVTSKPFVGDLQLGLVTQFSDIRFALTVVNRTDEFAEQRKPQRFGAFSVSFKM